VLTNQIPLRDSASTDTRGVGQDHVHHILHDIMQSRSAAFLRGRRLGCAPRKDYERIAYKSLYSTTCLY